MSLFGATAIAQTGGVPAGRFIFYPSVELNFLNESNVFLQNENDPAIAEISSGQAYLVGTFRLEMPFSRSNVSLSYSPRYRDYTDDSIDLPDKISHYFEGDAELNFAGGMKFIVDERFVRDNVTVQEFVGPEILFGTDTFTSNELGLILEKPVLPNHVLRGEVRSNTLEFADESNPSFFDTAGLTLALDYDFEYSPERTVVFELDYSEFDQDLSRQPVITTREAEDYTSVGFRSGLEGSREQRFYYNLKAGFENLKFIDSDDSDFNGLVADLNLRYQITPLLDLQVRFDRDAFPSFFEEANYYASNGLRVGLKRAISTRMNWEASAQMRKNRYPDPIGTIFPSLSPSLGVEREDQLFRVETGVGYQFLRTFFAGFTVAYEERDSNVVADAGGGLLYEPFDYDNVRAGFQLRFGWR